MWWYWKTQKRFLSYYLQIKQRGEILGAKTFNGWQARALGCGILWNLES